VPSAPLDYKFQVANGEILYVAIIHNRGIQILHVLPYLMNSSIALTNMDVSAGIGATDHPNQVSAASRLQLGLPLSTRDVGILLELKNGINS
jgi:hypothetical protein